MKTLYIGGQSSKKNSGLNWKIYFYLVLVLGIMSAVLKLTGPMIVEKWINSKGVEATGYAFSIRDVELSLDKGQMILKDVKVFNPETSTELLESPDLTVQLNLPDLIFSEEKMISVSAEKVDLILSKDLSSEVERKKVHYLDFVEAKIGRLTIIQKKEDQSRTVLELNEAKVKIKETEFNIASKIVDGGTFNLSGKFKDAWTINGSLKQVPSDIFNKIAGDKLPFAFNESTLNADITAQSENGRVSGEISPDVRKLNLLTERPGVPTQSIARLLTEELTFTLPFTLKDELTFEYDDTFRKLKTYRKDPIEEKISHVPKDKKAFSFWPF